MEPPGSKRMRTDEPELSNRQCKEIIKALMKHKFAHVFNNPVDTIALGLTDYFDKISHPMDFGTILSKVTGGAYTSGVEFCADVRLVFDNARTYNPPGSDVHLMATELEEDFDKRLRAQAAKAATALMAPPPATIAPVSSAPPPPLEPVAPSAQLGAAEEEPELPVPTLTNRQHSQLLRNLMRTEEAMTVFNVPVDPEKHGVPDYFSVILHPMDFGTVEKRVDANMYADTAAFVKDVRLVFSNAKTYNAPGTTVHGWAAKLEKMFETDLRAFAGPMGKSGSCAPSRQPSVACVPQLAAQASTFAPPEPLQENAKVVTSLCKPILLTLKGHHYSKTFAHPVDAKKYPTYRDFIEQPMDLKTVGKKLDRGEYHTLDQCHADIDLIWANCRTFNGENTWVTNHANALKRIADGKFEAARHKLLAGIMASPRPPGGKNKKGVGARPPVESSNEFGCVTPEMRHQLTVNAAKLEQAQLRSMMTVVKQCAPTAVIPTSAQSWEIDVDQLDIRSFIKIDTWVRRLLVNKLVAC